jgi:hypothetical protein
MRITVFWEITPCRMEVYRHFGGIWYLLLQGRSSFRLHGLTCKKKVIFAYKLIFSCFIDGKLQVRSLEVPRSFFPSASFRIFFFFSILSFFSVIRAAVYLVLAWHQAPMPSEPPPPPPKDNSTGNLTTPRKRFRTVNFPWSLTY